MMRTGFPVLVLFFALFAAGADAPVRPQEQTSRPPSRSVDPSAPTPPPADSLRFRVHAGEPLIFTLPDSIGARPVDRYDLVRAPALSWLVQTAFVWRTVPEDGGEHEILVAAFYGDATVDTLSVYAVVE